MDSPQDYLSFTTVLVGLSCAMVAAALGVDTNNNTSHTYRYMHRATTLLLFCALLVSFTTLCAAHIYLTCGTIRAHATGRHTTRTLAVSMFIANLFTIAVLFVGTSTLVYLLDNRSRDGV